MVERDSPRISVNKLGEYLVANAARRQRIISDQKRPPEFIVTRYKEAYEAISQFIVGGLGDESIIEAALTSLVTKPTTSDFQEQDRDLSIEALESFLDVSDSINIDGMVIDRSGANLPQISISGVSLSVRPELLISAGDNHTGAIKIYLSKSYPLSDEGGAYVATALHWYVSDALEYGSAADNNLCWVIDVFAQNLFSAPRAFARRRKIIEAACTEIARGWSFV